MVLQRVETYVSSENIDKGARWSSDILKALEDSFFGVLCITQENIKAPWINFEAGALLKSFEKSRVSPFLFGITRTQLQGPLVQFQSTIFEKEDIKKMVSSINKACESLCLEEARLGKLVDLAWPQLQQELSSLKENHVEGLTDQNENKLSKDEILEEILLLTRTQQQILSNPANILPQEYLYTAIRGLNINLQQNNNESQEFIRAFYEFQNIFSKFITDSKAIDIIGEDRYHLLSRAYNSLSRLFSTATNADNIKIKQNKRQDA